MRQDDPYDTSAFNIDYSDEDDNMNMPLPPPPQKQHNKRSYIKPATPQSPQRSSIGSQQQQSGIHTDDDDDENDYDYNGHNNNNSSSIRETSTSSSDEVASSTLSDNTSTDEYGFIIKSNQPNRGKSRSIR